MENLFYRQLYSHNSLGSTSKDSKLSPSELRDCAGRGELLKISNYQNFLLDLNLDRYPHRNNKQQSTKRNIIRSRVKNPFPSSSSFQVIQVKKNLIKKALNIFSAGQMHFLLFLVFAPLQAASELKKQLPSSHYLLIYQCPWTYTLGCFYFAITAPLGSKTTFALMA